MVTCCKVTGTNTPTQKTPSVCGQQRNVLPGACVCRKKKNDYCVCVCCTVFDTTHRLRPLTRVWGWFVSNWVCVGGFSVEGTPGPVPIPVAKLDCADGTAIVGLWESKTPPTHQKLNMFMMCGVCEGLSGLSRKVLTHPIFAHPKRRKAAGFMRKLSGQSHEQQQIL